MPAELHLGDESKLRTPRAFARLSRSALPQAAAEPPISVPVIGEQYRDVRLDAVIGESPLQTRQPFDPAGDDDDRALTESLASDGQRVPVLLVEVRQGETIAHQILDGHRRIAALRHLDRGTVKAVIYRKDSLECDLTTLTANVRKHLSPIEQARALARLRERHQLTNEAIAQKAGISRACFYQLNALLETDPAIQAEVEQFRLSAKAARALGKAPRQQQAELAQVASRYQMNQKDAQRLVERVAATRQTPDEAAQELGLTPRNHGQAPAKSSDTTTDAEPQTPMAQPVGKKHPPTAGQTLASARSLIVAYFSDLNPRSVQTLAEAAVKRKANANIIKASTLLVASGWEVADALAAAEATARRADIRKVLAMADLCADLDNLIAEEKVAPECAPMLAALLKKLGVVKQAALQVAKKQAQR